MPLLLPMPFLRPVALFHLHSTGQPLIPESARVRQSLSIKTLLLCKPVLPLPQLLRHPLELGTSISGGVVGGVKSVHPPVGDGKYFCGGRLHVRGEKLSQHLENARTRLCPMDNSARRAVLAAPREAEDVPHLAEDAPGPRGVASTGLLGHLLHSQRQGAIGRVKDEAVSGEAARG